MERYRAYKHTISISHEDAEVAHEAAREIAVVTVRRWNMQGAYITHGPGLWIDAFEHGANITIVTREPRTNEDMQILCNHVKALGLTAYVTVEETTAFELC